VSKEKVEEKSEVKRTDQNVVVDVEKGMIERIGRGLSCH
jgi:predicted transcriptional regulator of viral defense system